MRAGRDRVQMTGAENALPVGEGSLVPGDGFLEPAVCEAGAGQLLAGGEGGRVAGSLDAFPAGEGAPVVPDGVGGLARGQAGGGEFVSRAQGMEVAGAAGALVITGWPASRTVTASPGWPAATMAWPRLTRAAMVPGWSGPSVRARPGRDPAPPGGSLGRLPGGQQRPGQVAARGKSAGVVRPEDPVAGGGELGPVADGGPGQARGVDAAPGSHQEGVAAICCPEPVCGGLLEAGHAGPQARGQPRLRFILGPHLQQRVRSRLCRPVQHLPGHCRPDLRLDHAAHPHRWAARLAGSMASKPVRSRLSTASQARSGSAGAPPSARYRHAADVVNTVPGIAWPSRSAASASRSWVARAWREPSGLLGRQCPGDRRRGLLAAGLLGKVRPPGGEVVLVVTARQRGAGDHRAGLGERRRFAAKLGGQVDRPVALVWVCGQAAHQIVQGFAGAESPGRENLRPGIAADTP